MHLPGFTTNVISHLPTFTVGIYIHLPRFTTHVISHTYWHLPICNIYLEVHKLHFITLNYPHLLITMKEDMFFGKTQQNLLDTYQQFEGHTLEIKVKVLSPTNNTVNLLTHR